MYFCLKFKKIKWHETEKGKGKWNEAENRFLTHTNILLSLQGKKIIIKIIILEIKLSLNFIILPM